MKNSYKSTKYFKINLKNVVFDLKLLTVIFQIKILKQGKLKVGQIQV